MSVEATALSRSKLEQKDRSELAAIVEAMGGKAGSRAKKADLVDLVLELASQPSPHDPSPSSSGSMPSTPSASEPMPVEDGHANGDAAPVAAPADAVVLSSSLAEEPAADWEIATASEAAALDVRPSSAAPLDQRRENGPPQDD